MPRHTKYTPEIGKRIADAIRLGATYELAAAYGGVSQDSLARWRTRFADFAEMLREAEGVGAIGWLARIEQAAKDGDWRAAAWKLERRYPQDYGRTVQDHRHTHEIIRREAQEIAAGIGKADDPAVVAQIEQDLLLYQSPARGAR